MKTNTLREMCELVIDCPHFTPEWTEAGYLVIRNQNIRDGRLDLASRSYTHKADFDRRNRRAKPQAGDIVFTREAPMGEVCLVPEALECCIGQRQVLLRPARNVDGRYLFYALRSPYVRHQIFWNEGTGSTVSNVRIPVLEALKIPRLHNAEPPVGALLSALDDKIELNRKMNETLEAMARAIFKDWFVDFGPTRAKMEGRAPYLTPDLWALFPDLLDVEEKPEGWEQRKLKDLCDNIFSGGTPATTNPSYWDGGVPWLSSGETRNTVIISTERTITEAGVKGSSTRFAPEGSTVIASAGQGNTRGQCSFLATPMYVNQSVIVCKAKTSLISEVFLFFDLSRRYDELRQISDSNSSRGSLTTKMVGDLWTAIGDPAIQNAFAMRVKPIIEKIVAGVQENETLAQTRDLLLPKLMSGETRIKDAENIVGAVL